MPKFFYFLLLAGASAFSQNITIKGKILEDKTQIPLEAVTVYLVSAKDSTMIDYTITDKSGNFSLATRKTDKPVIFKVSFVGYQLIEKTYEKGLSESADFGTMRLQDAGEMLGEVVVKSEAPPIRIKNDTLEFNAASFKIRPDSNVETLLKQLPGVEIDADGKITVNGKEVNQILVNGKPFFDKDGKVALQNLPSDIINKVQITDTKSKKEEQTGEKASSNNASINLTIDEDKNKGFFGKINGGYGTDDRYESSLMLNYFKDKRKLSVIGSANNINSTGFSMNEIFDSMGGGRNSSVWMNDDGSFGINGMQFGGGYGITKSQLLGLNYSDELVKDFTTNGSYFYTAADTENDNKYNEVRLLPEGDLTTASESVSRNYKYAHNANIEFEVKPDSLTSITVRPKFVKAYNLSTSKGASTTVREDGQLANDSNFDNRTDQDTHQVGTEFYFTRTFKRKGRYISGWGDLSSNVDHTDKRTTSFNNRYEDLNGDGISDQTIVDNRNQLVRDKVIQDNYNVSVEYREPLRDSLAVDLALNFNSRQVVRDRDGLNYNDATGEYDLTDIDLSHYQSSRAQTIGPSAGISMEKKKFSFSLRGGTDISVFDNHSYYQGVYTRLIKHYLLPNANAWANFQFTKSMSMWMNYSYNVDFPWGSQILPIVDVSNPFNTIRGNAEVEPNKSHYFYLSLRDYDYATKSGWSIYAGGNLFDNQVVSSTIYDSSGKANTTYENVSGAVNSWFGGNWNKSIKHEAHKFRFGFGANAGYNRNLGYTNGELYDSKSMRITPRVNFNYDYGELLTISPKYDFTYTDTKYTNFNRDRESNVTHRVALQTTSYWPKHVVWGNDLTYTYNSNLGDGFKKDFYLWNMSLGYNFLGDSLLAKIKVYDLLNQNQNTMRTISSTTVRDEQNTVLKRYLMFSLTYSLKKFGGKKKEGGAFFFED
ncbi:outer membrane beta-barrel protein [Flavobacterium silvaticum]|uniref:Outer membrane beta-barrel protein n=1 Tax=Flavobacterium silvaticum TaxID=1852020 RepID=A0A972JHY6_9FLAO|nr:outer membrane beta-barrel protein [Flavobacterium silvaticum]NMH26742.1 outer membrane beta-barrel protein [Flavobacterium silvaticum]